MYTYIVTYLTICLRDANIIFIMNTLRPLDSQIDPLGHEPKKTAVIGARIPTELYDLMQDIAQSTDMHINAFIENALLLYAEQCSNSDELQSLAAERREEFDKYFRGGGAKPNLLPRIKKGRSPKSHVTTTRITEELYSAIHRIANSKQETVKAVVIEACKSYAEYYLLTEECDDAIERTFDDRVARLARLAGAGSVAAAVIIDDNLKNPLDYYLG